MRLNGACQIIASGDAAGLAPEITLAELRQAVVECNAEISAAERKSRRGSRA